MLFVLCCWRNVTKTLLIKLHMSTQWIHVYYYIYNILQFLCCHIILFCCIYPPHLKGRSMKILSNIKLVHGAKKVGDCCSNISPFFSTTHQNSQEWTEETISLIFYVVSFFRRCRHLFQKKNFTTFNTILPLLNTIFALYK